MGWLDWWAVDTYSCAWRPPVPAGESRRWTRRKYNLTALGGAVKWQNEERGYVAKRGCRGEERLNWQNQKEATGRKVEEHDPWSSQVAIKAPCAANSQMKRPFSLHVTTAAAFAATTVSTPLSPA